MTSARPSVEEFHNYVKITRSGPTADRYVIAVSAFLDWLNKRPILADTLARYSEDMLSRDYKSTTVRSHVAGVGQYFKWLTVKRNMVFPKFHAPRLPSQKRKVKDTLSPDTLDNFFASSHNNLTEPLRTAVMLLPYCGLRCFELATLPLACLQRQTLTLDDGQTKDVLMLRVKGKGEHERIVPLLDEGAALLVRYLKGWRRTNKNTKWLFPGSNGNPIPTRTIRKVVQRMRKPGEIYTPHSMRRTYLTTLFRQGVSPTVLAKIAGHGNVQVLINHYLDLNSSDIAGAVHASGGRLMKQKRK